MTAAAADPLAGVDVLWRPHPGFQERALAEDSHETLIGGAAGPGKTDCLLYGGLRQVGHPKSRQLFLRATFPELQEAMDRAGETFPRLGGVWNEQKKRWRFPSGARFEFGYCETYKHAVQYQGHEYSRIAWDELGQCPEERMWTYLLSRLRTTHADLDLEARASANPGGAGHAWLKRRFIVPCQYGRTVYVDPETGLTRGVVLGRLTDNPSLGPEYAAQLRALPEILRRQLLDGDWDTGEGLALDELDAAVHLVDQRPIPGHWYHWGAMDWGFRHPFCAMWFAADESGNVVLVDTLWARGLLPDELADRLTDAFPVALWRQCVAGPDCWADHKSRGETVPTIAEVFAEHGVYLSPASTSRVAGLNNFRRWVAWRGLHRPPSLTILRTPGNLRAWEQWRSMVCDPDRPEDALKVDADRVGEGGDDAYDAARYGLAARPWRAPTLPERPLLASDPEILEAEAERKSRHVSPVLTQSGRRRGPPGTIEIPGELR